MTPILDRVTAGDGRVLLVGEDNPLSARDEFALFSRPDGCSGHRLQSKILGLPEHEYLALRRVNLCVGGWDKGVAAESAFLLLTCGPGPAPRVIVMLGRKVAGAFGKSCAGTLAPFSWRSEEFDGVHLVSLPHPSGLCRAWNEPGAIVKARAMLRWLAPEVPWGALHAD